MKRQSILVLLTVGTLGALCLDPPKADAVITFDDGQTHNIDYDIGFWDDVWVDYQAPGTGTTLNLLDGGVISGELRLYENSTANVLGGKIWMDLHAWDSSELTLSGGSVEWYVVGHNSSQVFITGGRIETALSAMDSSRITMSGGHIGSHIFLGYDGASHDCTITFYGSDFAINGGRVEYGQYFASDYATGHLTGTLVDGSSLDDDFFMYDNASIVLAPEPSTLLLLGLGAVMVRRKRQKG